MNDRCHEFDRAVDADGLAAVEQERWRGHLAGCADCREQVAADALLRRLSVAPPPALAAGFAGRLRRRLEDRAAGRPAAKRPPARLRASGWWTLAAYGTAAAAASMAIVSHIPWPALTPSPAVGILLGVAALLSPLVLLDRVGIVRPPG